MGFVNFKEWEDNLLDYHAHWMNTSKAHWSLAMPRNARHVLAGTPFHSIEKELALYRYDMVQQVVTL